MIGDYTVVYNVKRLDKPTPDAQYYAAPSPIAHAAYLEVERTAGQRTQPSRLKPV